MALTDKHREPTPRELQLFGILLAISGGLLGGLMLYRTGAWPIATVIWTVAFCFCAFYYALPAARYSLYRTWMAMVYPLGWLISHVLLVSIYYLIITPIGLVMWLGGHDPLLRARNRLATTYWTPYTTSENARRYFQQF